MNVLSKLISTPGKVTNGAVGTVSRLKSTGAHCRPYRTILVHLLPKVDTSAGVIRFLVDAWNPLTPPGNGASIPFVKTSGCVLVITRLKTNSSLCEPIHVFSTSWWSYRATYLSLLLVSETLNV